MLNPLAEKDFYLLSALQKDSTVRSVLGSDPVLSKLDADSLKTLDKAIQSCGEDAVCHIAPLLWSEEEIKVVREELAMLYRKNDSVHSLVDRQLRESGVFELYRDKAGDELLGQAWADEVHAMNHVLEVYGEGHPPLYGRIDSISFDPHSKEFGGQVHSAAVRVRQQIKKNDLFFAPSLQMALAVLELNHRDEAARFEPMEKGENAAAYAAAVKIDWSKYPYTAIVIPGSGPGDPNTALSPQGKKRVDLAVQRFREGKAPFLLVSGGYVHPSQTRFCEAIEMKRYLVEQLGIPASVILIEPHARHTTTNLRNAVRILYRYSMPFDKPMLVTTDEAQSRYITNSAFDERCKKEMGLLPYLSVKRISPEDVEMLPNIQSLHLYSIDPLDP